MRPLVAIRQVSKRFGEFQALKQVSLDVFEGEVVCLIGQSGSGKTTLLRCVNQLATADSGGIWLDGELLGFREIDGRLHRLSERDIARQRLACGMVFQRFNLFPHMTALENLIEGPVQVQRRAVAEAKDEAMALLRRVGLADKAGSYPSQLSGGQQQRVAIARALAMKPRLVLFDEPTSALDPELRSEVLSVLRDIAAGGMTMLVVTHEMAFAREIADQVVFMEAGRIRFAGPPDAFFRSDDPRIVRFLSAILS